MDDQTRETRLRNELIAAAGQVDIGDAGADLFGIRRNARRRQVRRRVLGVAAGVTAVAAGAGVMWAFVGGGSDSVETDQPGTTVAVTTTQPAEVVVPVTAPAETVPPATTQPVVVEDATVGDPTVSANASLATSTGVVGAATGTWQGSARLMPWRDGFMLVEVVFEQPSPPPLSDEMRAKFPPEVTALFPDGLPPTIEEATQVLAEAGLLEVVTDLLASDPELEAAVLGGPATTRIEAQFSTDGDEWSPIDIELPVEMTAPDRVTSVGDRLIVTSSPMTGQGDVRDVVVASTTDLDDWTVQTIPIDVPVDLPVVLGYHIGVTGMVANDEAWVQMLDTHVYIDFESVLPDLFETSEYGYSSEVVPSGLEITTYGPSGDEVDLIEVGWAELGVDDADVGLIREMSDRQETEVWTAPWTGQPITTTLPVDHRPIHQTSDGFLMADEDTWFSDDGKTWAVVADAPDHEYITGTILLDTGETIFVTSNAASEYGIYLVEPGGGAWTPVTVVDGPPSLSSVYESSGAGALVLDGSAPAEYEHTVRIEHDGKRLTQTSTQTSLSYELVDIATGTVLAAEQLDVADTTRSGGPFELLRWNDDGSVSATAVDGDVLVDIPTDVVQAGVQEAMSTQSGGAEWQPDMWLLATADGRSWVFDDLVDSDQNSPEWFPHLAARNGDVVLLAGPDGWSRYDLAEG